MKSICLETRRWLLISQQKALTSEETQKHLWCGCKFPVPDSILTWDLLTTTYPNNRAVCGNLCNSRWNQRKSRAACLGHFEWLDTYRTASSSPQMCGKILLGNGQILTWEQLQKSTTYLLFQCELALSSAANRFRYWKCCLERIHVLSCEKSGIIRAINPTSTAYIQLHPFASYDLKTKAAKR